LFASFIGSFNLLRSKAAPESMAKVNNVNALSAKEDSSKNGLILYADSILRTDRITDVDGLSPCTVLDIEEALKGVNLLRNIKLIIYARKESNGRILKDVLNGIAVSSGKTMDIEVVTSMDVSASTEQDEAKELSALMNHIRKNASVIGVNNGCLLGVIKGQTMDAKNLESKAEELRLPVVSLESEEGIYSFIQALEEILMMRNRAVSYWLKLLPPVAKISEAVREAYEEYVRRREELETKA
jgi:hypothetical protein